MSSEKQNAFQEGEMQSLTVWIKSKEMNYLKTNQLFEQKIMFSK